MWSYKSYVKLLLDKVFSIIIFRAMIVMLDGFVVNYYLVGAIEVI
jgi:hypothetical protein